MVQRGEWLARLRVIHCDDIPGLDARTERELCVLHTQFYNEHQKWVTECPRPLQESSLAVYTRSDSFIMYARDAEDVLGFVSGSLTPEDVVVVSSIFVRPEVRDCGVALRLMRELIAIHSPREVVASVLQRNRAGNRFFARLGFNKKCSYGWCEYRRGTTGINNNDQNQVGFSTTGVVTNTK
jgi:L-amino acid N-acyltransferase YncA